MLGRFLVALAAVLLSMLPIFASGTVVFGAMRSFVEKPSLATVALLAIGSPLAYAWFAFLLLTAGWVANRRMRRFWVVSGTACGGGAYLALIVWLPQAALLVLPSVLFAAYVCWFHVEKSHAK